MQAESQNLIPLKYQAPSLQPSFQRAPTKKNDDLASLLASASLLVSNQDYENAYILMVRGLQIDAHNLACLNMMYKICHQLNKYTETHLLAQEILKLDYNFLSVFQVAQSFYIMGEDQKALDLFLEALSILTEDSVYLFEIYKCIGNIYVRFQDFDAAQEYYDKAYTLRPQSDILYVNYGTLEVQRGDYDKALGCFRDAVGENTKNSKAWVGMAMIHDLRADFELAWGNVIQAFDFDPNNKTALLLIYQWAKRDHREREGISYLVKYLIDHEDDEEVSLWLTHLYLSIGDDDFAKIEIEKILLFNSEHEEAREIKNILDYRERQR